MSLMILPTLMREVNATHAKGMDLFQQPRHLLKAPLFDINYSLARASTVECDQRPGV